MSSNEGPHGAWLVFLTCLFYCIGRDNSPANSSVGVGVSQRQPTGAQTRSIYRRLAIFAINATPRQRSANDVTTLRIAQDCSIIRAGETMSQARQSSQPASHTPLQSVVVIPARFA